MKVQSWDVALSCHRAPTFGGLFAAYAIYRAKYPEMFMDGSKSLDVVLGTVNTVILIFSSLTVAVAVKAIQENRIKLVKLMLWITIICAAIFAVNKYFEYTYKFSKGIFPGTDIFYSIYFASSCTYVAFYWNDCIGNIT